MKCAGAIGPRPRGAGKDQCRISAIVSRIDGANVSNEARRPLEEFCRWCAPGRFRSLSNASRRNWFCDHANSTVGLLWGQRHERQQPRILKSSRAMAEAGEVGFVVGEGHEGGDTALAHDEGAVPAFARRADQKRAAFAVE